VKTLLPLARAKEIAVGIVESLRPYCERIEVAGSIRRSRQAIGDIEIVAIPRWEERPSPGPISLFGPPSVDRVNLLAEAARSHRSLRPGDLAGGRQREIRDDGRYWQLIHNVQHVQVDLFVTTPERWGLILFYRTGPADFGRGALARWKRITQGGYSHEGVLHDSRGRAVPTPEEADVFRVLGLDWIDPADRFVIPGAMGVAS
jgi:DNA polymerase (family 10)